MPRSIHIIGSRISGGAERFCARLINSLAEQSDVLALNPENSPTSDLIDSSVRQLHPLMRSNYDLPGMLAIRKIAMQSAPAIVQTYMGRATRLTHIPHGKGLVHVARLGGYYNLKAYRHAHHLIGNTKGICDYLIKEGVPRERVHYIGNFVEPILPPPAEELDALRQSLGIPEGAFVITCAARFHENKGLPDLLEAFSKVWKKHPQSRLILVGDGPMADEVKEKIQALEIESAVILPGWCDPKPYYHLADVLVSPSRWEPLGNTILEAWACGKPLVATATMGAIELITPEKNGIITPVQNPGALADAFEQLMQDKARGDALAACGAQTVKERFSKSIITEQYLALYEQLLKDTQTVKRNRRSTANELPIEKQLAQQIQDASLVSFDIFDTLILRLLYRPEGVFRYIEESANAPGFTENRKAAAQKARRQKKATGKEEILLEEIYQHIDSKYRHLKTLEVELEIANHVRNPEIFEAYEFARRQGKTIILTSDMYLPREVLEQILNNCGYRGYHTLFLSQEDDLTKRSGRRFKDILSRFEISPEKMLHVGDSVRADVKEPAALGIQVFLTKRLNRRMDELPVSHRLIRLMENHNTGWSNLIAGCIAHQAADSKSKQQTPSYFYRLGYQYTGPFLVAFSLWLKEQTQDKGIKKLYFQARDGLIMKKVYDVLFDLPPEESFYLYASRAFFTKVKGGDLRAAFLEYLGSINFPKDSSEPAALVDVGRQGTMQQLLHDILLNEGATPSLIGFYFDLRTKNTLDKSGFINRFKRRYEKFLDFMDFLLIAPHSLIVGITRDASGFTPQYLPKTEAEERRIQAAKEMHKGILDFAADAKPLITRYPLKPDTDLILKAGRVLMKFTKEDKIEFKGVRIASGAKNEKYRPVVPMKTTWINLSRHSKEFWHSRRKAMVRFRFTDLFRH